MSDPGFDQSEVMPACSTCGHGRWVHRTLSGEPTACANIECACAGYTTPVPDPRLFNWGSPDPEFVTDRWPDALAPWVWPKDAKLTGVTVYSDHDGRSWECPIVDYQSGQSITVIAGDPPVMIVKQVVAGRRIWWAPWLRRHTIEITETPLTEVPRG